MVGRVSSLRGAVRLARLSGVVAADFLVVRGQKASALFAERRDLSAGRSGLLWHVVPPLRVHQAAARSAPLTGRIGAWPKCGGIAANGWVFAHSGTWRRLGAGAEGLNDGGRCAI